MSKDALKEAAIKSLVSQVLPQLSSRLSEFLKSKKPINSLDQQSLDLITEASELLQLLRPANTDAVPDLALIDPDKGSSDPMSDEDAFAMLQEMDAPSPVANPAMDELAKEVAAEIAAEEDTKTDAGAVPAPGGSMSDDEAMRLLMEMDEPAADAAATIPAAAMPAATPAPAPLPDTSSMSDDEAVRLLSEMDEPVAPITTDIKGVYQNPNVSPAPAVGSAAPQADDLDDETARMMADLEAQAVAPAESSPIAFSPSGPATPPVTNTAANANVAIAADEDDEPTVEEINEWDENQFSSDPEMLKDFVTNSNDLMEQLDKTILELEQDPSNKETIEAIFRAAHTLKGAAGMFGYRAIERVMHRMENLFDLVRKGKLIPTADTIDVVFQGLDVLKKLLEAVAANKKSGTKTAPIVRALGLAAKGRYNKSSADSPGIAPKTAPAATPVTAPATSAATAPTISPVVVKNDVSPPRGGASGGDTGGSAAKKKEEQSTIRVDLERLDALVNLVGELVIDRTRFASIEEELRTTAPQLKAGSNMTETVQLFGRHMNEIQDIIMKVRMVPIGNAFNKFPRVVRDLARQLGKQMDLLIDGEGTELDKTLVEQIADPLVHLIRNACDHGIEMPAERMRAGKQATGKIILAAKQEGNHIIISISDDGKGMNVEKIRAKGIERGLISADANLSEREIFNLIFESGFSTAEAVTTVSGRGVGMDVVRKQIAKLKGMVEINSTFGKGSTITIQLPLTLAIVESLLVNCQGETFAIPLSSVIESERIKPSDIQKVGDAEVIKLRNHILPIVHLSSTLELSRKSQDSWYSEAKLPANDRRNRKHDRLFVVVVGSANQKFGIVVDQLLNQQEMVIKPMGPIMRQTPCVSGGAVLGNGEVVLVLDIQSLIENFRTKARQQQVAS